MVSNREARTKKRASGCWAGTTDYRGVTLPVSVRKVSTSGGRRQMTDATRAWISTTARRGWPPMSRAPKGILGAQEILPCEVS